MDASAPSGGDTQLGLDINDPGADSPRLIIYGLDHLQASDFILF